jgi:hypothetical protein
MLLLRGEATAVHGCSPWTRGPERFEAVRRGAVVPDSCQRDGGHGVAAAAEFILLGEDDVKAQPIRVSFGTSKASRPWGK